MSSTKNEALFQLKIDFLQFMIQVQDWHDPNMIIIVYALLMENRKITQAELMELTGLNRTTISETLSLLINDPRGIPVLQTRKPGDNKKYYYCPLTFEKYIKRIFGGALESVKLNLEFVPHLLKRLKNLKPQNDAIKHTRDFFLFFYIYNQLIHMIMKKYDEILTFYFENPETKPVIEDFMIEDELNIDIEMIINSVEDYNKKDSLDIIKKHFISEMLKLGQTSSTGTNKEIAYAFFLLYLNNNPITQEDLIKITKSRRAAVSEAFSLLVRQKFATEIKKPNDRKKYYGPNLSIEAFISSRIQLSRHKINQIELVVNNRFLSEIEKISTNEHEKKQIKKFFLDTAHYYRILGSFMSDVFDFVSVQLKKIQSKQYR